MSCNGCRVLRKGCSDACVLRCCLQCIDGPEAQAHATVFVAKFFGRAGLISFLSAVPESHRPDLFRSLLYEACGRTINPVNGAVGLLWSGNWHLCQAAVETVLRGGVLAPISEVEDDDDGFFRFSSARKCQSACGSEYCDLDLSLKLGSVVAGAAAAEKARPGTPSGESVMTCIHSGGR
ncbi:hypothetical protein HPP92_023668 [Vanilla planifolia]|uniref:LOB domain-containing protein n=1 Tax=Vanilla planifolia TaxID=51239 RepID=A0A835PQR5_VANPL|nr:hypothetical protein HPP92_023668 [Vanilla planifolia]